MRVNRCARPAPRGRPARARAAPARRRRSRIEADHRRLVGDEAAQPGPAAAHACNGVAGGGLESVDRDRDVELLGLRVARRAGRLVGRREQQQPGIGLEVERLADVHRRRPALRRGAGGRVDPHRGAALGHEPDRRDAREPRHLVAPGAGRIDDDRRAQAGAGQLDVPVRAATRQRRDRAVEVKAHALAPAACGKPLQYRRDVDVERVRLEQRAAQVAGLEGRDQRAGPCRIEADRGELAGQRRGERVEKRRLVVRGEVERAALRDERVAGEARGRMVIEVLARARQRADRLVAVDLAVERGRAPGRVIARLRFALDDGDARVARQLGRGRHPGHAGADDDEVEFVHAHGAQAYAIGRVADTPPAGVLRHGAPGSAPGMPLRTPGARGGQADRADQGVAWQRLISSVTCARSVRPRNRAR